MNIKLPIAVTACALALTSIAMAQPAPRTPPTPLHKHHACITCHAVQTEIQGTYPGAPNLGRAPSYHDIALKFKKDPAAKQKLVSMIMTGTGHLKIQASEADLQTLVTDVLATP